MDEASAETGEGNDVHVGTNAIIQLTRLARVVYRASPESLLGIKLKELGTLAYLRDHGEVSQGTLTTALCMDANSCVLLLKELEAAEYIRRKRDPEDRRRHLVEITWTGLRALDMAEAAQATIEDDVLGALSSEERAALRQLLTRALEGTDERSPDLLAEVGPVGVRAL